MTPPAMTADVSTSSDETTDTSGHGAPSVATLTSSCSGSCGTRSRWQGCHFCVWYSSWKWLQITITTTKKSMEDHSRFGCFPLRLTLMASQMTHFTNDLTQSWDNNVRNFFQVFLLFSPQLAFVTFSLFGVADFWGRQRNNFCEFFATKSKVKFGETLAKRILLSPF